LTNFRRVFLAESSTSTELSFDLSGVLRQDCATFTQSLAFLDTSTGTRSKLSETGNCNKHTLHHQLFTPRSKKHTAVNLCE